MKIEEDRLFLHQQREQGRAGHLCGMDKKSQKEERIPLRAVKEENGRMKYISISTSSASYELLQEDSSTNSSETMASKDSPTLIESSVNLGQVNQ